MFDTHTPIYKDAPHKVQYSLTDTASKLGESPISPLFMEPVQNSK